MFLCYILFVDEKDRLVYFNPTLLPMNFKKTKIQIFL